MKMYYPIFYSTSITYICNCKRFTVALNQFPGLGIPFLFSALLIVQLKSAFDFIKRHYKVINIFAGILLIVIGLLMITGIYGRLLATLSFG